MRIILFRFCNFYCMNTCRDEGVVWQKCEASNKCEARVKNKTVERQCTTRRPVEIIGRVSLSDINICEERKEAKVSFPKNPEYSSVI
jgi:hypothetical protein